MLVTSLVDERLCPTADFLALYGLRWGIETFYALLKGRLEVERCSGLSLEAVRQDFFASGLLTNLDSVLGAPAQSQLTAQDRQRQQALQVNRARSFHALKSPRPGPLWQPPAHRGTPGPAHRTHAHRPGGQASQPARAAKTHARPRRPGPPALPTKTCLLATCASTKPLPAKAGRFEED